MGPAATTGRQCHGSLLLIEGRWHTGGGIAAADCERLVRDAGRTSETHLLPDEVYWGGPITDERYLLLSSR